jgi:hypothetical protein
LNDAFSKHHAPFESLAVDKVTTLLKGWVIFKQYISKKHKRFGTKMYKLFDISNYDMGICSWEDMIRGNADMTATHAAVKQLTEKVEEPDMADKKGKVVPVLN